LSFVTYDIVDGQKKCNERHGKKQKSEQSLDSMSKQLTTVMSTDIVQSNAAAAAVDSDSSVVDARLLLQKILDSTRNL